ncbi:hypothetical protein CLOM_g15105 [Closterium sp. NIES-68]|nr:hypothetical protein CLOM_g15105 [Closterium sp. NIES-68]GJP58124.1 hypothetical protein CLOP_g20673 [Closterium sp. NIES-67]
MEWGKVSDSSNVVYLSQSVDSFLHKCKHTCDIQHVWANLYRCRSSNTTHICDKNCNQKILYDNYSSICMVSRNIAPLTDHETNMVKSLRKRREVDGGMETCGRQRKYLFRNKPFSVAVPAAGAVLLADSFMADI